jgi:hypothetical protein
LAPFLFVIVINMILEPLNYPQLVKKACCQFKQTKEIHELWGPFECLESNRTKSSWENPDLYTIFEKVHKYAEMR